MEPEFIIVLIGEVWKGLKSIKRKLKIKKDEINKAWPKKDFWLGEEELGITAQT